MTVRLRDLASASPLQQLAHGSVMSHSPRPGTFVLGIFYGDLKYHEQPSLSFSYQLAVMMTYMFWRYLRNVQRTLLVWVRSSHQMF